MDKELIDDMVDEEEVINNTTINVINPRPGDADWEEFVLSKLTEREIDDNGRPSTAGLRRIAPSLLGRIIDSGPIKVNNPCQDNDHRATVIYEITYLNKYYDAEFDDELERIIKVREVSDAWEHNIDGDDFKKHPTSIASTRAEGRALRKALLLSVAVKEEISTETYVPASSQEGKITTTQKNTIINLCKRKNIDVQKLIEWGKNKDIEEVTKEKAVQIIKFLNDQAKIDKAPKHIFNDK